MCSKVFISSVKFFNNCSISFYYGTQISTIAISRNLRFNHNMFNNNYRSGINCIKMPVLQPLQYPNRLLYRAYSDILKNQKEGSISEEKEKPYKDKSEEAYIESVSKPIQSIDVVDDILINIQQPSNRQMSTEECGFGKDSTKQTCESTDLAKECKNQETSSSSSSTTSECTQQTSNSTSIPEINQVQNPNQNMDKVSGEKTNTGQKFDLKKMQLKAERILYLILAASIDAFYAILASNEVKLIKLTAMKTLVWLKTNTQKHILDNPKFKNKLEEVKLNVEQARKEDKKDPKGSA